MKRKIKFILPIICVISVFAVMCIIWHGRTKQVNTVNHNIIDRYVDLNNDKKNEKVSFYDNNLKIDEADGKTIFEGKVNSQNDWSDAGFIKDEKLNTTKIIVSDNTKDTSAMLTLKSYSYENGKVNENVLANNIYKGKVELKDNNIIVSSPLYSKGDSNAVPSRQKITTYKLADNKLTTVNTEEKSYKLSSANLGTAYYKNPSYDELKKIIDNVAREKCIPPEVLEAVAWQESKGADYDNNGIVNWRQFANGQPVIGYDHIGIGIMQVSDYNSSDTDYVNRLKYDVEFNIRQGAEILLKKWARETSTSTDKIPKVGDGSPLYREHWYYAIWAYNSYSEINNPASHYSTAYQTLVIGHMNNVFHNNMIDLYLYNSSLFAPNVLPTADISELTTKNAADIGSKRQTHKYIVTVSSLALRDDNMNYIGSFSMNDVVQLEKDYRLYNGYMRYYVTGNGKSGWVAGNWLELSGDTNNDNIVDLYDCVNISRHINGSGTAVTSDNICDIGKYDVNGDGIVDNNDIKAAENNWN